MAQPAIPWKQPLASEECTHLARVLLEASKAIRTLARQTNATRPQCHQARAQVGDVVTRVLHATQHTIAALGIAEQPVKE